MLHFDSRKMCNRILKDSLIVGIYQCRYTIGTGLYTVSVVWRNCLSIILGSTKCGEWG